MELFYRRWPDPSPSHSTTHRIVLLHGMGGTGALWRPIAAELESSCDVLAPDQRGHGGSVLAASPTGGRDAPTYTPLDYGRDVVELMDRLSFKPAWIVGHSMGVRTACAVAHLAPSSVQGLVLVDLGFAGAAGGGLGMGLASFLRKLPASFPSRAEARAFMSQECPDPSITQYLMAVSVPASGGELSFPFDRSALIQTIEAARDVSVRAWIRQAGEAGKPVVVLRGANSLVWSHEEFQAERERFKDLLSIRFEEIAGAGHGLPFEQRRAFTVRLLQALGTPG